MLMQHEFTIPKIPKNAGTRLKQKIPGFRLSEFSDWHPYFSTIAVLMEIEKIIETFHHTNE